MSYIGKRFKDDFCTIEITSEPVRSPDDGRRRVETRVVETTPAGVASGWNLGDALRQVLDDVYEDYEEITP